VFDNSSIIIDSMTWKLLLPTGFIAFMLLMFGVRGNTSKQLENKFQIEGNRMELQKNGTKGTVITSVKPANGNIDDTLEAFMKAANDEESALSSEEAAAAFIKGDTQAAGEFGQIVNENDF
jgi:hypothetical protein